MQKKFSSSVFNRPTEAPVLADASVVPDASGVPGAPDRGGAGSSGRLEGRLAEPVPLRVSLVLLFQFQFQKLLALLALPNNVSFIFIIFNLYVCVSAVTSRYP